MEIGVGNEKWLTKDLKMVYVEHEGRTDFAYLVYKGKEAQEFPFRGGRFFHGFKYGDYCSMIMYPEETTSGVHCIIDKEGLIMYEAKGTMSYPSYIGGVIASTDEGIMNLKTDEIICPKCSGNTLESDDYYFVKHKYSYSDELKKFKTGVYKIHKATGQYEIFEIKK